MSLNGIGSINTIQNFNYSQSGQPVNHAAFSRQTAIFRADSVSLSSTANPENPFPPQEPPVEKPSFFNRPAVRIAGMSIASGIAFGAVGAAIGAAAGNVGMGLAIGGGFGLIVPMALVLFALKKISY